ncbi:aminoglycoside phosphotransferase [Arsenicicoccus piscis]|uniref:Aminoglycoside phosphotransferase n=1 Tax=Arsenicicoccus piscis TaxID=673954 RepID=A0ABQ6HKF0_9MICO|nr:aminoglycoside phosphotransferase [Arsenicicoccus piscis]
MEPVSSPSRRPLTLAALASAAVRDLDPVSVSGLHTDEPGVDQALVTDTKGRTWHVVVPRSAAQGAALDLPDTLLPLLDARLPFDVPRPSGYAAVKGVGRAAVHPHREGHQLALESLPAGPGLAATLGRLLAAIHELDPAVYEEAGVPVYDAEGCRRRRLAELDQAAAGGHVPPRLLARWERALDTVTLWRFAPTPTHGPLHGAHVVVAFADDEDSATGEVVAVSGWHHAQVGDPADDFALLCANAPADAFDTVLEAYAAARTDRPDRGLVTRARLAAELELAARLSRARADGDPALVETLSAALADLDERTAGADLMEPQVLTTRPSAPGGEELDELEDEDMAEPTAPTEAAESTERTERTEALAERSAPGPVEVAPKAYQPEATTGDIIDPGSPRAQR